MGIGLTEDMINELRDENVDNYIKGVDDEVPVFYVEGQAFKSPLLKSRYFDKDLRGSITENLSPDERERMELMAKTVDIIYDRRKAYGRDFFNPTIDRKAYRDVPNQDVGEYKFEDTENDLTGLFVNGDKKETILAVRGLLPNLDKKDLFQFPSMIKSTFFEKEDEFEFGTQFNEDKKMIDEEYRQAKIKYPNHKIIAAGHSRGSRAVIYLGRKHNLEFHAFSPAVNRGEFQSVPIEKGNIYYHHSDPVSIHYHKIKGNTVEQHHESFNNRLYPHSTKDFYDEKTKLFKHSKITQRELDEFEKELLLDMNTQNEDVITAEEYVLSDLGIFDDEGLSSPPNPPARVGRFSRRRDYSSDKDPRKENTNALNGDDIIERKIFNEYIPSVYNDLSIRPAKPFNPNITFDEVDGDKSNSISYKEFENFFIKRGLTKERIKEIFDSVDVDRNNSIDRNEFNKVRSLSV